MPDVQVGLGAVVGDEHLAVLERVHRAGIDVQVRIKFLHRDPQTTGGEQLSQRGRGKPLAERGGNASSDENVYGRPWAIHGVQNTACAAIVVTTLAVRSRNLREVLDGRCAATGSRAVHAHAPGHDGVLMSGQHAGDLHHPLVVVEAADIRSSDVLILLLEHSQMGPGEGRHLRHMRDHDDLRVLGQLMQPPADGRGGRTSHTGVDLVEHERANRIGVGEHDLEREHDAAELTTPEAALAMGAGVAPGWAARR